MSITANIFCPECDSILDISRIASKKQYDIDIDISSDDDNDADKIKILINKILNDEIIEKINNIKIDQITTHPSFIKIDNNKKKLVLDKVNDLFIPDDASMHAFYVCKTCSWSQKIKPGTQIMSKIGTNTQTNYLNMGRYKNKIYNRVIPRTRNFICPNTKCIGKKDISKHEAVIYRHNDSMKIMYTCVACQEVFFGQ
jgi:DNA-directed RNA polymerase subunit M/transcription elongation factor TFIIS